MADQKLELTVRVNSDTGQLDVVSSKLKTLDTTAQGTQKSFMGLTGSSADLAKNFLPFITVVGGATFAIDKLTSFVSDAIKESEEYRQAMLRMQSAVETTGGSWKKSGEQIEVWAQAIQKSTRFSDGQAIGALDRLTRATGNLELSQKLAGLSMDISVKSGKDLNTVMDLVTRLTLNQNRALTQAKLEFGNVLDGANNFKDALTKLSAAYGGAAVSERTLTSESEKLKNEWDDVKKNVGNALTPALLSLTETFNGLFPVISKVGIIIKSYFTKGSIGTLVDFKEIKASFDEIDKTVAKTKKDIEDLKNGAGGLGSALKDFDPKPLSESGGGGESKEEKAEREKKESNERLSAMEDELNVRMAQLGDDSLQKKLNVLKAEETAEINTINKIEAKDVDTEKRKQATIAKTRALYRAKEEQAQKEDAVFKTKMALDTASIAISALQMINNAGEINSKNDARRAKLLLALQQAITIANIWASNTKLGPWGVAKSIAETGLAVAAFAVQSKAIDKARAANDQEISATAISTDVGGDTLTEIHGTGAVGQSGGVGSTGGGGSFGVSGGGGGGGGTFINVGGVVVNFTAGSVDTSSINQIARQLGDAVQRGTTDAVQMAIAFYATGQKNSGVAR